jgi:type I restriction enzyme M protein
MQDDKFVDTTTGRDKEPLYLTFPYYELFRILNTEPIPVKDQDIVLFFISVFKDGIFELDDVINNQENAKQVFYEKLGSVKNDLSEIYQRIFEVFKESMNHISNDTLIRFFLFFEDEISSDYFAGNFSIIFSAIHSVIAKSQGEFTGKTYSNVELDILIFYYLSKLPQKAKIFDPFAGLCYIGSFLENGHDYFGQEINPRTWALGALGMLAGNKSVPSNYVCGNSIEKWPSDDQKFDLIVTTHPIASEIRNRYSYYFSGSREIEELLLRKGITQLTNIGKLIAVVPKGMFFWGKRTQYLRKLLIDNDLIDMIISIPGGILAGYSGTLYILVVSMKKELSGHFSLVNAKNFVEIKGKGVKSLNIAGISNVISGDCKDPEVFRKISNEQIKELDYNLFTISRFFQKDFEGVRLSEVFEIIKGTKNNLRGNGKLVRISDLKNDNIDYQLDCSTIEVSELKKNTIKIDEPCFLMAARWRKLKPTLFKYEGEPIYITPDIIPFKVNETITNVGYLINELHADYVEDQIAAFRLGDTIPFIRPKDLLDVKIKLPSLAEQNAKIEGVQELTDKIKLLQIDRNALANGLEIEKFREFASLKHTLGRPRQNILDWSDNLLHFLSSSTSDIGKLNKSFADFYDVDIFSALKEIKRDINFITDVLEKGEKGINPKEFEKELISLAEINSLLDGLSSNGLKFRLVKLLIQGEKLKERGVEGNKILFQVFFDNLLTNADKHAFLVSRPGDEMHIELSEEEETLLIEVKNNGQRFPQNFDREKFITKYSTANSNSGSGLGGYDIHRIADYFGNPNWELILNQDPIYPVWFRFQFPIKIME